MDAVSKAEKQKQPGIFAMIAKISLGLRKFRNHSENFARLAKFRQLAKFTVPSDIFQFRYLAKILLG